MRLQLEDKTCNKSSGCYRILSLSRELQNGGEAMKPVLDEAELKRLCVELGVASSPGMTRNTDSDFHEDFDQEFARYLRNKVFPPVNLMKNDDGKNAEVLGVFGKQKAVKQQLEQMNIWTDKVGQLSVNDQGIYCLNSKASTIANGRRVTLVVFTWLADALFEPVALRDMATYMLRFLSNLTSHLVCCVVDEDVRCIKSIVAGRSNSSDDEDLDALSYSARFKVECQEDARDKVTCSIEHCIQIPESKQKSKVLLVDGSYLGVVTSSSEMKRKMKKEVAKFPSVENLCRWIENRVKGYRVDLRPLLNTLDRIEKKTILETFERHPKQKLEEIDAKFTMEKNVKHLFQAKMTRFSNSCFSLSLLSHTLIESYKSALDMITSAVSPGIITKTMSTTTQAPIRLFQAKDVLVKHFNSGNVDEVHKVIDEIIDGKTCPKSIWSLPSWSWFSSEVPEALNSMVLKRMSDMHNQWLTCVNVVLGDAMDIACMNEFVVQELTEAHDRMQYEKREAVQGALVALFDELATTEKKKRMTVRCRPGAFGYWKGFDVESEQEETSMNVMTVHKYSSNGLHPLGTLPFDEDEGIIGVYTVQAFSLLVVSSRNSTIRVIQFASDMRMDPVFTMERTFKRPISLSAFNVNERILAVLSDAVEEHLGVVRLFRFSDNYNVMDRAGDLDLDIKTTLEGPIVELVVVKNAVYVMNKTGMTQSINFHSQQVSRKFEIDPLDRCEKLFCPQEEAVLMVGQMVSISDSEFELFVSTISQLDHRFLPDESVGVRLLSKDVSIGCVGNVLYILDLVANQLHAIRLDVSIRSDSYRIRHAAGKLDADSDNDKQESWLRTLYHMYEKFPVRGSLHDNFGNRIFRVLFSVQGEAAYNTSNVELAFKLYLETIMSDLRKLNKTLYGLDLASNVVVGCAYPCSEWIFDHVHRSTTIPAHELVLRMVTFVPLQICRAEDNTLNILGCTDNKLSNESLQNSTMIDAADIAGSIRFGLLSVLLDAWQGRCVVISSMGKQSTGKSYFLNHLTGSSFNISGSRCTDGAWMSLKFIGDVLLVILDFEGLGSFERSEQEDVFLAVLNSSISLFTIFRSEMRFDKDIDDLFNKFQKGMKLIKGDRRLFRGKLYMSVKDVNPNDARGVTDEFVGKLDTLLHRNKDANFLSDMYSGDLSINCSPPLGTRSYYRSLDVASQMIRTLLTGGSDTGYASSKDFSNCLRLVLAKIHILDWTSLDDSAKQLQLTELTQLLPGLVRTGCKIPSEKLDSTDIEQCFKEALFSSNDRTEIEVFLDELCARHPNNAAKWEELNERIPFEYIWDDGDVDFCINLNSTKEEHDELLLPLGRLHRKYVQALESAGYPQKCHNIGTQEDFDAVLSFLVHRRCARIEKWASTVLQSDEWNMYRHQMLGRFKAIVCRCQHQCSSCKLGCMKPTSHSGGHDCDTLHRCNGQCSYCFLADAVPMCSKEAGHEGVCECKEGDHSCGLVCVNSGARNCDKSCSLKRGHEGGHLCSVKVHVCPGMCSAKNCNNSCTVNFDMDHSAHKCALENCLQVCFMEGCERLCSVKEHFHGHIEALVAHSLDQTTNGKGVVHDAEAEAPAIHMCDGTHECMETCEEAGICKRNLKLKKTTRTFQGSRGSFRYTYKEMNASRKKCSVVLQPKEFHHEGKHTCAKETEDDDGDVVHYCDARCRCCDYFCDEKYGHEGMHTTAHGNMIHTRFYSDTKNVNVQDRQYESGESGTAEMCNMYCSKMGRGHVHYLPCTSERRSECTYTGSEDERQHCTRKLIPQPEKPLDEVLHGKFWETLGWEDPCTSMQEKEEFRKCGFKCDASEHSDKGKESYCTLPAWHRPSTDITNVNGHEFECQHIADGGQHHHIFVLDSSGSMSGTPWDHLLAAYREYISNRLTSGGLYRDIVTVITFACQANIIVEGLCISSAEHLHIPYNGGGTCYSLALREALGVLSRTNYSTYKPAIIFFSDGHPHDPVDGARMGEEISRSYARYGLRAFAVGFGSINLHVLKKVASKLGGTYMHTMVGNELRTTFCKISASLSTKAGLAIIEKNDDAVECPICKQKIDGKEKNLSCGHCLHQKCFDGMKAASGKNEALQCPFCRVSCK
uniref:Uncharacterized protein AlNc14C3G498 n=1 Tax=Albugo laibachii Nc14 TaxID=890382 RepID=F0W020_9STRA|nr:conserved hypothetical protein [Albugo laibachii Nc14]|eukprot:CCA14391.1 conserved hypothetical protein [Albugo laibachii Nc14]